MSAVQYSLYVFWPDIHWTWCCGGLNLNTLKRERPSYLLIKSPYCLQASGGLVQSKRGRKRWVSRQLNRSIASFLLRLHLRLDICSLLLRLLVGLASDKETFYRVNLRDQSTILTIINILFFLYQCRTTPSFKSSPTDIKRLSKIPLC